MADIDAEGKIYYSINTIILLFTKTATWNMIIVLDVLRSSHLNNEFHSNVVYEASIFLIKHPLQHLMCFSVVWHYGSGGGEIFYISVSTPSLYNTTLTLQSFTH